VTAKKTLTRQELYDLVWAEPMRTLAATYGVSDVWLKKVCAKAEIPSPDRGYWAKLSAGKLVVRAKLPPRAPGMPETLEIKAGAYNWRYDPVAELAEPIPEPPVFAEPIDDVRERVAKRIGKVVRCKDLSAPCPVVRKQLQADDKRREKFRDHGYSWDAPLFDSPFEVRRLRVLNAIGLALPRIGGRIESGCKSGRMLSVTVGTETMELHLDHPGAKPTRWGEWSTRPGAVDTLKLELKPRYPEVLPTQAWVDAAGDKLEDHLTEITIAIAVAGEAQYRQHQASHHDWLLKRRTENEAEVIRRRLEAEKKERERLAKEQAERRERLFGQAKDWRPACDIRGFVEDVLASGTAAVDDLAAWARWARAEADVLDPVLNGSLTPADTAPPPATGS
jgi:hypothetical protein